MNTAVITAERISVRRRLTAMDLSVRIGVVTVIASSFVQRPDLAAHGETSVDNVVSTEGLARRT